MRQQVAGEGKRLPILHRLHEFAFTTNLLFFSDLRSSVKAMKAKNKHYIVETRAYARGKRVGRRVIYLREKCNSLRGRKNYL